MRTDPAQPAGRRDGPASGARGRLDRVFGVLSDPRRYEEWPTIHADRTEEPPAAGSDAFGGMKTTATPDAEGWRLNGPHADTIVVYAGVEQVARDAKSLMIYAGSNEVQVTHIASDLLHT